MDEVIKPCFDAVAVHLVVSTLVGVEAGGQGCEEGVSEVGGVGLGSGVRDEVCQVSVVDGVGSAAVPASRGHGRFGGCHEGAVVLEDVSVGVEECSDALDRVGARTQRGWAGGDGLLQFVLALVHHRFDEAAVVAEAPIHRSHAHAGGAGDLVHCQ